MAVEVAVEAIGAVSAATEAAVAVAAALVAETVVAAEVATEVATEVAEVATEAETVGADVGTSGAIGVWPTVEARLAEGATAAAVAEAVHRERKKSTSTILLRHMLTSVVPLDRAIQLRLPGMKY